MMLAAEISSDGTFVAQHNSNSEKHRCVVSVHEHHYLYDDVFFGGLSVLLEIFQFRFSSCLFLGFILHLTV